MQEGNSTTVDSARQSTTVEERLSYLEGAVHQTNRSEHTNIPLVVAIIAAAAGLIGQAFVAWYNADAELLLERQRLQQQLLLNAVKADVDQAKENLDFLLDTGLLVNSETVNIETIRTALAEGKTLSIPTPQLSDKQPSYIPTTNPKHCKLHLEWGVPSKGTYLFCRRGFAVLYDTEHHTPKWVSYQLTAKQLTQRVTSQRRFRTDPEIIASDTYDPSIFRGSGYDRGHLVPVGDARFDTDVEQEANFISNITPQYPKFNRGIWVQLERKVREWAANREVVLVLAGPIYHSSSPKKLRDKVSVPDQFFKIVFDPKTKQALAFAIPHNNTIPSRDELSKYLVSIDTIESKTGLDFLSKLDETFETSLEKLVAVKLWNSEE